MARVVVRISWGTNILAQDLYSPLRRSPQKGGTPSSEHLLMLLTFFVGLALLVTIRHAAGVIPEALYQESVARLSRYQASDGAIEFRGRDAVLTGASNSPHLSAGAVQAVRAIPGVRSVRIRLLETAAAARSGAAPSVTRQAMESLGLPAVQFAPASASLTPDSLPVLDRAARVMLDAGIRFEVRGHTDADGDALMNQALSLRRAEAVRAYLEARGLPAGRLTVAGFGSTRPVADNATEAGRRSNRRIEFHPEGAAGP